MSEKVKILFRKENRLIIMAAMAIFIMAVFLRFFRLGELPYGLHIDEASMAYDAFCIANYGVDRYLYKFPVYFINYGGGQSALYTYLCAFFIKIAGMSDFVIRLPGAINGMVIIIAGSYILKKKFKNPGFLLGAFLLTICPYFIMQSRFGLDCNLMIGTVTVAMALLISGVTNQKSAKARILCFSFAGIMFGLTLYTYALSYLVLPVFLSITCIYLLWIKQIKIRELIVLALPIIILAIPLLLLLYINYNGLESIETPFFSIPILPDFRGGEFGIPDFWYQFKLVLKCIFLYDQLDYNAFEEYYTLYLCSIPFAFIGFMITLVSAIRGIWKRVFNISTLVLFLFLTEFALGMVLVMNPPNINKLNGIFFTIIYFVVCAIVSIANLFKNKIIIRGIYLGVIGVYLSYFVSFASYYYGEKFEQPLYIFSEENWHVYDLVESLPEEIQGRETYIYQRYIYYLLDSEMSPYEFNLRAVMGDTTNITYKNIHFFLPGTFEEKDVVIVDKDDPVVDLWKDISKTGIEYDIIEEGEYIVFFKY